MIRSSWQKNVPMPVLDTTLEVDHHVFNNYEDYNKVKNFYSKLKDREFFILTSVNTDNKVLKKYNEECINSANDVYLTIRWVDYYEFDWIIASPLLILGSFAITFGIEAIAAFFPLSNIDTFTYGILLFGWALFRSIAALFIMTKIVKISNDIGIGGWRTRRDIDKTQDISHSFALLMSFAVMGIPMFFVIDMFYRFTPIGDYINNFVYLGAVTYGFDALRMIVLASIISQKYKKRLRNIRPLEVWF